MQRDRWIAELLSSLAAHVTPSTRNRLAAALTPLFGSDAVLWTRDTADLTVSRRRRQLGPDGPRVLITAALAESAPSDHPQD
jgi:hypothetical protein